MRPRLWRSRIWQEIALGALVLGIAAALRLTNLLGRDPFVDEVAWQHWATSLYNPDDPATLWVPVTEDGRPPLFYWFELGTLRLVDNGFVAGRLAAAVPSIVSVLGVYGLGRVLFGVEAAFLAALLWAISPLAVFFGRIGVDDALLSLWTILAALTSVVFVKKQSILYGLLCGVCLGLAILTKPLGLLALPMPLVAWLILDHPNLTRRMVLAWLTLLGCAAATSYPLAAWIWQISAKASAFADISIAGYSSDVTQVAHVLRHDLLQQNTPIALGWLVAYLGMPVVVFAALGAGVGIVRGDRSVWFLGVLWILPFLAVVDRTTVLYSRYLLSFAFPLIALAVVGVMSIARVAGQMAKRLGASIGESVVRRAVLGVVLLVAGGAVLPVTLELVVSPERAALPAEDRVQYFEQWFAFYGLGRVANLIQQTGAETSATVLVPQGAYPQQRVGDALQVYLRGQNFVRFVPEKSLNEGWSLCALRPWLTSRDPVFVVLDGTDPDIQGPASMPAYTRTVQTALARDLPSVGAPKLSVPRPAGDGWMAAYRLDQGQDAADGGRCSTPARSFGNGWHEMGKLLGGTEPGRWTSGTADYTEGPLPAGWYRLELYARTEGRLGRVAFSVDDIPVWEHDAVDLPNWRWIETSLQVQIAEEASARVRAVVQSAPARLIVGRLLLQRVAPPGKSP